MPRIWSCSSFLCACLLSADVVRAGTLDVQDNSPALVYNGTWFPDASPNAHGKHETWTNASGASVYYDFQGSLWSASARPSVARAGSQVEVFATLRPTGTYLTNVSFRIDDNAPDFWVSNKNVPQETFNKLVYTSPGTLSTDGLHRITITNYGFVFWLVYLEITTPDVSGGNSSSSSSGTSTSTASSTGTGTQSSSAGTSSATSGSASSSSSSGSASRTPVIIGAVVGSVGGATLLLAALWFWCMYSRSRRREREAMAPTPFAGEGPSPHFTKDRPPANPSSRFQRWITDSQATATEPGYGYPSTGATEHAPQERERARSEPVDAEALKQLAVFRSAAEARAAPDTTHERSEPLRGTGTGTRPRPPPAASIPSVLETPHPSTTTHSVSPRSAAAPVSRSGALARAFTFSSRLSRDPARAGARPPPSDATMSSALASSGVLPPPSLYTPPGRNRPVFFRVLRRSRDGGVRLAGGAPQELDADMMAPEEYDQQILEAMSEGSTLPPEYQQYPTTGGEGERVAGR
ncbi:hypothetical protein GSI_08545 [Ganoderma sinense ZZ0214-1]|uniref:Transporter n=1 Tax=Ganoderma sinense ZZ0214-1 TaxID=1077348 RepID=A0A2G8S451_9APHY|nr:hypothetical protein GSI_08545 [Ganoderma sinense ZZ0214-1]